MKLMNERNQVRSAIERCLAEFTGWRRGESGAAGIVARVGMLDPESSTSVDLARAIGNGSWCSEPRCAECGHLSWDVVQLGEEPGYGSKTVLVCVGCLRNAVRLVKGEAPPADPIIDPVRLAIGIAIRAHDGQIDKAERPYIGHPLRVMGRMPEKDIEGRVVAVLHDVLEDTSVDAQDLRESGFSERIITALERLTHKRGEPYEEYLRRIAGDDLARRVKLADIADNADEGRLALLPEWEAARLREKYARARSVLESEARP